MSGTPAVNSNTLPNLPIVESVSLWVGKLVAPLSGSVVSEDGVIELSGRVKLLVGLIAFSVIAIAANYIWSSRSASELPKQNTSVEGILEGNTPLPEPDSDNIFSLMVRTGNLEEAIVTDIRNLNAHFEMVLRDLPGNGIQSAEKFEQLGGKFAIHLRAFQDQYQLLRGKENCRPHFEIFDHLKKYFSFLVDIGHGIIRVPSDGNCLFHAVTEGFRKINTDLNLSGIWEGKFTEHVSLRDQVVEWMRKNIEGNNELRKEIDGSINKYIASKMQFEVPEIEATISYLENEGKADEARVKREELRTLREELDQLRSNTNKYGLYFDKVDKPGFFASDAEIYAVSRIFNVKITVEKEFEGKIVKGFETVFNYDALIGITLVHRNEDHFDYRHYECVVD